MKSKIDRLLTQLFLILFFGWCSFKASESNAYMDTHPIFKSEAAKDSVRHLIAEQNAHANDMFRHIKQAKQDTILLAIAK